MHSYWKFDTVVRRGYVYYMPEEKVDVTQRIKNYVEKIVREERLPPVNVGVSKCLGCGYYWVCRRA